jgi:hypothetical protein
MMNRKFPVKRYLLLITAFLLLPNIILAQTDYKYELYVNGGFGAPYFPKYLDDNWQWGFNGGIGLGYRLSPKWLIEGSADLYTFNFDAPEFYARLPQRAPITTAEGKMSNIASLSANVRYFVNLFAEDTFLYFMGGMGAQRIFIGSIKVLYQDYAVGLVDEDYFASIIDYGFQMHFATGFDIISTAKRSYFGEVRYTVGFLNDYNSHVLALKLGLRQSLW